jgi:predicted ATPase
VTDENAPAVAEITSGARTMPDRQRTLRNAIAWSYDLLEAAERRLFARLSVFTGGWTLDSAAWRCSAGRATSPGWFVPGG